MNLENDNVIVERYIVEIKPEITSIVKGLKYMNRNWKIIHYVFGILEIIFGTLITTTILTDSLSNIVNGILAAIATIISAVYIFLNVPNKMSEYSKAITLNIEMQKKFIYLSEQIELGLIENPKEEWLNLKAEFDKINQPEISLDYQRKYMPPSKYKRTTPAKRKPRRRN